MTNQEQREARFSRTRQVNRLQRRHPGTRRQRINHGAGHYSVQFFDRQTGALVADYDLSR